MDGFDWIKRLDNFIHMNRECALYISHVPTNNKRLFSVCFYYNNWEESHYGKNSICQTSSWESGESVLLSYSGHYRSTDKLFCFLNTGLQCLMKGQQPETNVLIKSIMGQARGDCCSLNTLEKMKSILVLCCHRQTCLSLSGENKRTVLYLLFLNLRVRRWSYCWSPPFGVDLF